MLIAKLIDKLQLSTDRDNSNQAKREIKDMRVRKRVKRCEKVHINK